MRILVAYGSKREGTKGIAETLAAELVHRSCPTDVMPAGEVGSLDGYDVVVCGGALYAGRWHRAARRFVARHARALRDRTVFLFSSGPLDDSASSKEIPPTRQVRRLMRRVGAVDHRTFGGRLAADAKGFPAASMAKQHAGDWRDPAMIRAWADQIATHSHASAVRS